MLGSNLIDIGRLTEENVELLRIDKLLQHCSHFDLLNVLLDFRFNFIYSFYPRNFDTRSTRGMFFSPFSSASLD